MNTLMIALALLFSQCDKPHTIPNSVEEAVYNVENLKHYEYLLQEIGKITSFSAEAARFKEDSTFDGITFTGSSMITRWETLSEDFPLYKVRNHGIGGSCINHIIAHSENLIFHNRPKVLILYIGDNDANHIPIETFKRYMDCFTQNFRHRLPESFLVFLTVKPSPARAAKSSYHEEVNRHLDSLAATSGKLYCVDIRTPMKNGDTPSFFIPDMIHPNRKGYELIISKLSPVLKDIMKK